MPSTSPEPRPGFTTGVATLFRSAGFLLNTPRSWPLALVPALVLLALAALFVALAIYSRPARRSQAGCPTRPAGTGVWAGGWCRGLGRFSPACWAALIALAATPPLSAPALERLVELEEQKLGVSPRQPIGFLAEMWCGLRAQAAAACFAVPLLTLLWIVDLAFPPASVVTVPLKMLVASLSLAWNLFDYPLTLRGVRMRDRFSLIAALSRPHAGLRRGVRAAVLGALLRRTAAAGRRRRRDTSSHGSCSKPTRRCYRTCRGAPRYERNRALAGDQF